MITGKYCALSELPMTTYKLAGGNTDENGSSAQLNQLDPMIKGKDCTLSELPKTTYRLVGGTSDENGASAQLNQLNQQDPVDSKNISDTCQRGRSTAVYIGETARTLRQRAGEHWNTLNNWSSNSFMLRHWISSHGTLTEPPNFSFKVLKKFTEPMGRQIFEALKIVETGYLNLKTEYGANHLCGLQSSAPEWEKDKLFKEKEEEKRKLKETVKQFAQFMSQIRIAAQKPRPDLTNELNFSRSKLNLTRKRDWCEAEEIDCYRE